MDREVRPQWLRERKVIKALRHGQRRVSYMDNCSGHGETAAMLQALNEINTEVRFSRLIVRTYCSPPIPS